MKENVAQSTRNNVIPSAVYPNAPLDLTTNPKNEQNSDNESIQLPLSFTKSCWRSFLVKFLKLRMEKSWSVMIRFNLKKIISIVIVSKLVIVQPRHIDNISRNQTAMNL